MVNEPIRWRVHPEGAVFRRWSAPAGAALRRMDWPAGKPRGSLLFAGGRGDFIEKHLEAYADWRADGWNVTSFDWRGQGGSRAAGDAADFGRLAADLAALIADWRGEASGPHVAIAHSMGGHVLLRVLIEHKPALDAAVLVAPMISVNGGPVPLWLAPGIAEAMCALGFAAQPMWKTPKALTRPGAQRQQMLTHSRARYEDELAWWQAEPGFHLGAPSWGWLRAAFRSADAFTPERLATVDLPILILATERDRLVNPAAIRRVAGQLPRAALRTIDGAAHEILREADPLRAEAMAAIRDFLAGL